MNKKTISILLIILVLVIIGIYFLFNKNTIEEQIDQMEDNMTMAEEGYVRYENDRYDYTVDYPEEFTPQGEAQNNDGQVFSSERAEIRVFGTTNVENESLETVARRYIAEGKRGSITVRTSTLNEVILEAEGTIVKVIDLEDGGVGVLVIEEQEETLTDEEIDEVLESFDSAPTEDTASMNAYFMQQLTYHEEGGPMPIEGYDANLLLGRWSGLITSDFEGVEALQGYYLVVDGELTFTLITESEHSAAQTISEEGYGTLLQNVSDRLGMETDSEADIDLIIEAIN